MKQIFLSPPDVSETERQLLLDAFDSNWISPVGPHLDAFEREFAAFVRVPHAVALSSGTAALHLALQVAGVQAGQDVMVCTLTFAASANPVTYLGAKPVFVDVSPDTWTLDPWVLAEELDRRARNGNLPAAIVPVDLYGQCADYDGILEAARRHNVPVIPDAAEAVGSTYEGRPAGSFGLCSAFSFNGNKVMTTSGGGMLVTDDGDLASRVRYLATQARDPAPHYQHAVIGFNYRLSNLLAAVGRGQLATLPAKLERRRQIRDRYIRTFENRAGIQFMPEAAYGRSNCWLTCVLIDPSELGVSREDIRRHLAAEGIESRPVWKPLHLQPAFSQYETVGGGVAASLFERGLCLPSGSGMSEDEQTRVIDAISLAIARRPPSNTTFVVDAAIAGEIEHPAVAATLPKAPVRELQPSGSWWSLLTNVVRRQHRFLGITTQLLVIAACNYLALLLRFDGAPPAWAVDAFRVTLPWLLSLRAIAFLMFRLFQGLWRFTSLYDLKALLSGIGVSTLAFAAVVYSPLGPEQYPRSIILVDAVLATLSLGGLRMARRLYTDLRGRRLDGRRVLIYGAGSSGEMVVREMRIDRSLGYVPIAFVDDDREKTGRSIHGVRVVGTQEDLGSIIRRYRPDEILIAMPSADPSTVNRIIRQIAIYRVAIKTVPHLRNLINGRAVTTQVRTMAVEDFLPRTAVVLDPEPVKRLVAGRRVLVTGAGGTIGAELSQQLARYRPSRLILMDRDSAALQEIQDQITDRGSRTDVTSIVADLSDETSAVAAFDGCQPELVFHAAHSGNGPLLEQNPVEAVRSNLRATRIALEQARRVGSERFTLISSHQAATPVGVMSSTRWLAEALALAPDPSEMLVSVVRIGTVLGKTSIVTRLMEQIQNGGPVRLTDPSMHYRIQDLSLAGQCILWCASSASQGLFVVDSGPPLNFLDIATNLMRLSGVTPYDDIKIEFTGLRCGEWAQSEITGPSETREPTAISCIARVIPADLQSIDAISIGKTVEQLAAVSPGKTAAYLTECFEEIRRAVPTADESTLSLKVKPTESLVLVSVCPSCHRPSLNRSKARSMPDRLRRNMSIRRPYRCSECSWRGWLDPRDLVHAAPPALNDFDASVDIERLDKQLWQDQTVADRSK